jgi:hypothetical protein
MRKPTKEMLEDMLKRHTPKQIAEVLQVKLQSIYALIYKHKIEYKRETRPPKEDLERLIKDFTLRQLGAKYGVSRQCILLWLESYNLSCPKRTYHHHTEESMQKKKETFSKFRNTKEMDEKVRQGLAVYWSDPDKRKEFGQRMSERQAQKPMISPTGDVVSVHKDLVLEHLLKGYTYSNNSSIYLTHKETKDKKRVIFVLKQNPCKNANQRLTDLLQQGYMIGTLQ